MLTINLGKLEPGDSETIVAQLRALQAAGLQDIQLQVKGKESREFLNHLVTKYDHKRTSRQQMISTLLIGTAGSLSSIILGLVLWL